MFYNIVEYSESFPYAVALLSVSSHEPFCSLYTEVGEKK